MADIVLLDGGMGQELVHRSGDAPTNLWATRVMLDHPGMVAQVHGDYFAAGATLATTNTYAIHRDRLVKVGMVPALLL
jgi:homocysteine S-methyltransferase